PPFDMAEVQVGTVAVVWGLATGATATGLGTFKPQSSDFEVSSEVYRLRDGDGKTVNKTFYDASHRLTLRVVPYGSTISDARAANILPAVGAIVTVSDTRDTEIAGTHSGKYHFVSGKKTSSNTNA